MLSQSAADKIIVDFVFRFTYFYSVMLYPVTQHIRAYTTIHVSGYRFSQYVKTKQKSLKD